MLKILSVICYVFAIADLGLFYLCDVDITGVWWSPWLVSAVGALLSWIDSSSNKEGEEQQQ